MAPTSNDVIKDGSCYKKNVSTLSLTFLTRSAVYISQKYILLVSGFKWSCVDSYVSAYKRSISDNEYSSVIYKVHFK